MLLLPFPKIWAMSSHRSPQFRMFSVAQADSLVYRQLVVDLGFPPAGCQPALR